MRIALLFISLISTLSGLNAQPPSKVKPENLGSTINSIYNEVGPIISYDGRTLYFQRFNHPDNVGGEMAGEDIWYSTLGSDGKWTQPKNIGSPLNNPDNNFVTAVTPDGNTLLVGNVYLPGGAMIGGISLTNRTQRGWEVPKKVVIDDFYNASNQSFYSLSPDGKTLIVEVEGHETFGTDDLYVSFRKEDGTWTRPGNLGSVVNSTGSEITPFLAADNQTLYFSSNGHGGSGDQDVFVTRRLDDSWTKWSKPENLGSTINTRGWDAYYTVPAAGDYAYFVSHVNSIGNGDIFRIKLPESARPKPVSILAGHVYDAVTRLPISSTVNYKSVIGAKEEGIARTDPTSGSYSLSLPAGGRYTLRAGAPGYREATEDVDLRKSSSYSEITRDIYLQPVGGGSAAVPKQILFDAGSADLRLNIKRSLDLLATEGKNPGVVRIEIIGHTDDMGTEEDNLELSNRRAAAVAEYLRNAGVPAESIEARGMGETQPEASNQTAAGRQSNRRAVVEITMRKAAPPNR